MDTESVKWHPELVSSRPPHSKEAAVIAAQPAGVASHGQRTVVAARLNVNAIAFAGKFRFYLMHSSSKGYDLIAYAKEGKQEQPLHTAVCMGVLRKSCAASATFSAAAKAWVKGGDVEGFAAWTGLWSCCQGPVLIAAEGLILADHFFWGECPQADALATLGYAADAQSDEEMYIRSDIVVFAAFEHVGAPNVVHA
jgi:hypothetical protein